MAESIIKDYKGKADWVYVGKAEPPKIVEKKPDTLFNEYMQKVLDVTAPVALQEYDDAAVTQGAIAGETIALMGNNLPKDKDAFFKKWMAMDKKHSSPEHENRLGKLLTAATYMGGSFLVNMGGEKLATMLYRKRDIDTGNIRMLDAGWEYLTDYGIEKAADSVAKKITNREDIGFISPLSRMLGKIGNTIMSATPQDVAPWKKSLWSPGFIEGAFRFAGAIPGAGLIKELYGKANKQIMKGEGIIPMGAELAFNMALAKVSNKEK